MVDVTTRDYFTEEFENSGAASDFYIDSAGHLNYGYGIDVTANEAVGDDVAEDVIVSAVAEDPAIGTSGATSIENILNDYIDESITTSTAQSELNTALASISDAELETDNQNAMDLFFNDSVVPSLQTRLGTTIFNALPSNVQLALEEIKYNASISFLGPSITSYIDAGNIGGIAYELALDTAGSDLVYGKRLVVAAAQVLGFDPSIDGSHYINGLTATSVSSSQVLNFVRLLNSNDPASYLATAPVEHFLATLNGYLVPLGYYVVQPGDTTLNIISTLTSDGMSSGIDADALLRINAQFGVSGLTAGTLLHIPFAASGPAAAGYTNVFDQTTGVTYTVGTSLDSSTSGQLILDDTGSIFGAGSYQDANLNTDGSTSVVLSYSDPVTVGTLTIGSAGAGSFALADGATISLSGLTDVALTTAPATDTPEQAVLSYLAQLGDSTTATALDAASYNSLDPTGTTYTLSGSSSFVINFGAPGAVIAGGPGTSNSLEATFTNLSRDSISNVQILDAEDVEMTAAQFNSFTTITGGGGITITTAGTCSLAGQTSGIGALAAQDWGGTTLTGDNTDGQILAASLYGDDTLNAGNGAGDVLDAGEGVDTLNGGTGGDTFAIADGLASGSSIAGAGTGNVLGVNGNTDITGLSISDVQTLEVDNGASITMTASQFSEFSGFTNDTGETATIVIVGSGSYSLSGKTVSGSFTLITDSGSSITGNSSFGQALYAPATGTSTVNAGDGTGDVLIAGAGTDTLNAGSGGDALYDGTGTATLNGGSDLDTFYVSNPLGGTTVNAATGGTVYVSGNTGTGAVTDTINMSGGTLYVGAGADADIYGSNNTIITSNNSAVGSHDGDDNTVTEGDSAGVWLLDNGGDTVDAGAGDYVYVSGNGTSSIDNTVNISSGSVDIETNTQTDVYGSGNSINVGENDLAGAHNGDSNTVTIADNVAFWLSDSGGSTVTGGTGDYVSVTGNGTSGDDNVVNTSDSEIDIADDTQADVYGAGNTISIGSDSVSGVNGNTNTISLGSGTYYWVNGGTGNTVTASSYDTITIGGGVGATVDGGGNDSYQFGSTFGATTIDNNASGGLTAANGTIGFGSGITDENLWFKQSGNNLLIELLGTTDTITVDNWFGSNAGAQVSEIDADGLKLTTAVASLVSAMATYQSANLLFNPQTASSMPTDTALQNAIAGTGTSAWHS